MSKQKKYHYIYKTTCKITGKFYIGMHSTDILEDGYLGSGKILGYSRAKYGDENHVREILEHTNDRKSLVSREKEIVNEELLKDPLNINIRYGGLGGGGANNLGWNFLSFEQRSKIGKKGGKAANLKKTYEERCLNSKKAAATKLVKGTLPPFLGKSHTEETKEKMRITRKNRNLGVGEQNSRFGNKNSCINKDGKNKRVPVDQLDQHLVNGWLRGLVKTIPR